MTAHILGIGAGLFVIITIWSFTILVCALSLRTQKKVGSITVGALATFITLVLLVIPRESEISTVQPLYKLYDSLFIWRTILVILLGISALAAFALFVALHLMEPRRAQIIKQWKL